MYEGDLEQATDAVEAGRLFQDVGERITRELMSTTLSQPSHTSTSSSASSSSLLSTSSSSVATATTTTIHSAQKSRGHRKRSENLFCSCLVYLLKFFWDSIPLYTELSSKHNVHYYIFAYRQ